MPEPLDNFNKPKAEAAREAAIESIDGHTRMRWKRAAFDAVCDAADRYDEFTTDEVWKFLLLRHPALTVHDNRAMGPIMRHAGKLGLIETTERYVESERISNHSLRIRVWRSLVR